VQALTAAALSGGAWLPALPLANLLDMLQAVKARSVDCAPASTQFYIDLGISRPLRLFAAEAHNFSETASWRISGSNSPDMSSLTIDNGWQTVYPTQPTLSIPWESPSWWSGVMTAEQRAYYPSHAVQYLPGPAYARYLHVEISDPNNPAGYVELGRIFAGPAWVPRYDMDYGIKVAHETATTVETMMAAGEGFDVKPLVRVCTFDLDWLTPEEVFGVVFDLERQLGIHGEAYFVPFQGRPDLLIQSAFPCRLQQLSEAEHPSYGIWKKPFKLKERIG
jgi:hypothetical protein